MCIHLIEFKSYNECHQSQMTFQDIISSVYHINFLKVQLLTLNHLYKSRKDLLR
jgi:hypothetical protein